VVQQQCYNSERGSEVKSSRSLVLSWNSQQPLGAPGALRTEINDLIWVVAWTLAGQMEENALRQL